MLQVEVSHKSEMAGPFNTGDIIINKQFILLLLRKKYSAVPYLIFVWFDSLHPIQHFFSNVGLVFLG